MQGLCSARPLGTVGAPTSASGSHKKWMVVLRVVHAAEASPSHSVRAKPPLPVKSTPAGRVENDGYRPIA